MTPEALLVLWREAFEAVKVFEHAELDEVGLARLAELRAREASLAEQVRDAGLVPEGPELRVGTWAPLPLYMVDDDDDSRDDAGITEVAASDSVRIDEPRSQDHADFVRWIDSIYSRDLSHKEARKLARKKLRARAWHWLDIRSLRLLAAVLEDFGNHGVAHTVRSRHAELKAVSFEAWRRAPQSMARPYLPSARDGLTHTQRTIVEVLAESAPDPQRVKVLFDDALLRAPDLDRPRFSAALVELLSLPYSLVEVARALAGEERTVRLTSLGRELVHRTDDGRFRVHGAFVPNLLINGCGEPLAFPTHTFRAVVGAVAVLARVPGASVEHLSYFMRPPGLGSAVRPRFPPYALYDRGHEALELVAGVKTQNAELRLGPLLPNMTAEDVAERVRSAARIGLLEGFVSVTVEPEGVVSIVFEHRAFASLACRKLVGSGFLVATYETSFLVDVDGRSEVRSLRDLLAVFLEASRAEVKRRLSLELVRAKERLDLVEGLLRAADHEAQVTGLIDRALDTHEAIWALTHVGTTAFLAHPVFGRFELAGLGSFSDAQARLIAKSGRLGSKRPNLLAECDELVARIASIDETLASTIAVNELVITELDRIVQQHSPLTPQSEPAT